MPADVDVVLIGAGHNCLVAANMLAERGKSVLVLEGRDRPGGAVKSGELTEPGYTSDLFSSFYPLAAASPALRALDLEQHGLRWLRSEYAVAHPKADGSGPAIARTPGETAALLDAATPGDGDAWRRFHGTWEQAGGPFIESLLSPFPPLRGAARLAAALGPHGLLRFARLGMIPVRRLAEETFSGQEGGWLLAGNALHADLTPDSAGGGLFGWVLCGLGQQHGFPVPAGGAGMLAQALVSRLDRHGGRIECSVEVDRVLVRGGRAVGVRTQAGDEISAGAVLAGTGAPRLFLEMVGAEHLPAAYLDDLRAFQYDSSTVKVDWSLDGPIPWASEAARKAGTVHVAKDMDALTLATSQLARSVIPERPFLVMGQYSMVDPSRQPEGKETAWAYTHVPQHVRQDAGGQLTGSWDQGEVDTFAGRVEDQVERLAPGFRELIRKRHVFTPRSLEAANPNLVGGAMNSGTAQIHQQLVFRPASGPGRSETPVRGLYLAGASAHPGGGVHGAAGANAARALLAGERARKAGIALVGTAAGLAAARALAG